MKLVSGAHLTRLVPSTLDCVGYRNTRCHLDADSIVLPGRENLILVYSLVTLKIPVGHLLTSRQNCH